MPLGLGTALWGAILPVDEYNIARNPSFEFGTTEVNPIQGATLGTTSQFQRYGAWALQVTPSSNGTSGVLLGTTNFGNGTTYNIGAWIYAAAGVPMLMGLGNDTGVSLTSSTVTFTGGGSWQWYETAARVEIGNGTRGVVVQKTSGASVAPFYVDGLKISAWSDGTSRSTTYFDGDTGGGTWLGGQQASASFRTGQYRGGGSIVALSDLGFQVDSAIGVGVPPIENSSQSYAVVDGAQFQRTRVATRHFTLTAKPINGTSTADFHNTRRAFYDAIKPDLVSPQQPVRFLYVGAQGTQQIDAYYEKGMELGNMDGPMAEDAAIGFVSYDPYWYSPTQQGTTLSPRSAIGSMNYMAKRSPLGKWGSVGQGAGPNGVVYNLMFNPGGTLFACGSFTTLDGTVGAKFIGMYNTQMNTWGTLIGGTVNDEVGAMAYSPTGTLFFGGLFTTIAGTVGGKNIGRWANNLFGTLQGGTVAGQAKVLMYSPTGTLFVGGVFTTTAGTTSGPIAIWTGAFGTLKNGSLSNPTGVEVDALLFAQDRSIYAGGTFNLAAGTTANHVARYFNGTWGTMTGGVGVAVGINACQVTDLKQGPNGVVYMSGLFGTAGGITTNNIAQWNGVAITAVGAPGLGSTGIISFVRRMVVNQQNGNVLALGSGWGGTAGVINVPDDEAVWNGASYTPLDIDLTSADANVYVGIYDQTGALYVSGSFVGTAQAASVGTIVNAGRGAVYPTMRVRNLSATGTGRQFQLLNTTTGAGIYFNYSLLPSEQITLVTQPGTRSFQSTSFGNIFNSIIPGSNLATFNLSPGTNYISYFSDSDSLEVALFWQPRGASIDGGTIT